MPIAAVAINRNPPRTSWEAELQLKFARHQNRSVLVSRQHRGPLVVQKALYPEGDAVCHTIILHPPGGVASGDKLKINAELAHDAHALLTVPGAGKWYKAGNGVGAFQHIELRAYDNAVLEWLPQETIIYNAAQAEWHTKIELAESANYAGWEIICLGRQACGETFNEGQLHQRLQIYRSDRLIWGEYSTLKGGDTLMTSPVGLRNCPVFANFVIAAGATPQSVLESCRTLSPEDGGYHGVTALPEVFVSRYIGHSAQAARHYFEALWAELRPWYAGIAAQRPRIWNT